MRFHIVTLFPDAFSSYLGESILKRAIEDKKIFVKCYNPRDFVKKPRGRELTYAEKRVDGKPYGGGPGMVMEALPVAAAIEKAVGKKLKNAKDKKKVKIVFFSPSGAQFTNAMAGEMAEKYTDIVFICGRYEGIDARIKKIFPMADISVGPFVLTGGELPAMILVDTIARQIEGVLGNFDSREEMRASSPDVYTRPEVVVYKKKSYRVPKILLSGDHKKIDEWRANRRVIY